MKENFIFMSQMGDKRYGESEIRSWKPGIYVLLWNVVVAAS